ncbi:4a-hydroxytetrahydrobiopterin dehydratase [Vreelandella rituensis]|uniref:Putative pterin-4-alpha-carbinolamine dehydratase n=1 Tax=Vreelandella rituensis TaxID=2282306 RepID=A0A368U0X5_9GAMM|nr:4a-hydroxytetrahydrobiopterin dehydratase [Halomonas rituensis]RCV90779.1 4a-hydroxytetrahydrobiopterin dehydratase [Halomonas rituensis]
MTSLSQQKCEACSAEATPLTREQSETLLKEVPEWRIVEHGGIMKLMRSFTFRDFAEALAFTQGVGDIAEQAGHHPEITTEWGKTTVTWWSHAINGLHRNDFILAARTDEVAN